MRAALVQEVNRLESDGVRSLLACLWLIDSNLDRVILKKSLWLN